MKNVIVENEVLRLLEKSGFWTEIGVKVQQARLTISEWMQPPVATN